MRGITAQSLVLRVFGPGSQILPFAHMCLSWLCGTTLPGWGKATTVPQAGSLGPKSRRRVGMLVCSVISMWLFKMKKKDFVAAGEEEKRRKEGTTDCEKHSQGEQA